MNPNPAMHLEYYKLKADPFLLTPDPRFLHFAQPHRKALLAISDAVVGRRGFMLMTGPTGTGKTTLINFVLAWYKQEPKIASAFIINPLLTRDELLESIIEEFEIPCSSSSKPQRLQALHKHLLETQDKGGTSLLIIDEAHLLTVELLEEIRLLGNIDSFKGKLLQIVLCGQPELASVLLDRRLKSLCQRIAVFAQLRPLSPEECWSYVVERLQFAGLAGQNPFTRAALIEIQRCAGGVPRLINLLGDACLRVGHSSNAAEIGQEIVARAAAPLGMLKSMAEGAKVNAVKVAVETNPIGIRGTASTVGGAVPGKLEQVLR